MRSLVFIVPLLTMVGAAPAAAQRMDPRLEAVLACPQVTDDTRRLACFDAALVPLVKATESGALERRSLGPKGLESTVRATRPQGPGRLLVQLENGDRWALNLEGSEILPRAGDKVTLRRGVLGSWWFKADGGRAYRATLLEQPAKR